MQTTFEERIAVAVAPESIERHGDEEPVRAFGVYRLGDDCGAPQRYRFGAHPQRQLDLRRRFGGCELLHVFLAREDAEAVARHLNGLPPRRSA